MAHDGWRHAQATFRLSAEEFIRRFLLHVLPQGFVRIRHYGLLASRNVPTKLTRACELLKAMSSRHHISCGPNRSVWLILEPKT
jgi:hypothetical protein